MTKEEIEHEKLWTEGIVSAVMLSSKGIVSDFIINLEKVGYKIVKSESENERLKAERDSNWISLERAKKYARHQHYLGTQGNELVEFEDWECKPPKQ